MNSIEFEEGKYVRHVQEKMVGRLSSFDPNYPHSRWWVDFTYGPDADGDPIHSIGIANPLDLREIEQEEYDRCDREGYGP